MEDSIGSLTEIMNYEVRLCSMWIYNRKHICLLHRQKWNEMTVMNARVMQPFDYAGREVIRLGSPCRIRNRNLQGKVRSRSGISIFSVFFDRNLSRNMTVFLRFELYVGKDEHVEHLSD